MARMADSTSMNTAPEHPRRHLVSAQEYLRMGETGVFSPEARLELIEGEIIEMAPIGPQHAYCVNTLLRLFVQRAGELGIVSAQNPIVISSRSVPEPDVALLKPRRDGYRQSHPESSEVLLAVEVSDSTAAFDIERKVPLYGRCGIPEVWVVDVSGGVVRVYRQPSAFGYGESFTVGADDRIECELVPQVWVAVRELFPDDTRS